LLVRSDAGRILIAPLRLRDIGRVIPVELLEKRVIGILQLVNGFTALRMAGDSCISIDLDDAGGNERIVAQFEMPEPGVLLPCIPASVRLFGRAVPDDLLLGEVGHILECQATSVRTGHIEQLPVEADLLKNRVTKSDP